MINEILKKQQNEQQDIQKISRKKYFGEKEEFELQRINKRSTLQAEQENLKTLLYNPDKNSDLFLVSKRRFDQNCAQIDKQRRVDLDRKDAQKIKQKTIQHLIREKDKWQKMNGEYQQQQDKIDKKQKRFLSRPFFNSQGFDIINMKYQNNVSGNILQQRDLRYRQNNFKRAENLFNKNNNEYDIFTGKPKCFKPYKPDILDKIVQLL